jgi:hypothetical protein
MSKEIDILLDAHRQGCLIVDKISHVLLEPDALVEATKKELYLTEGTVSENGPSDVSGPFPGCMQLGASADGALGFRLLGQTEHFVIFFPAGVPTPRLARSHMGSYEGKITQ